ncbi:MAG: nucleotidyltransferase domain-containing protein [Caldilineaceae bacterium]
MNPSVTEQKRQALLNFIQSNLAPEPAVQAVIGIGSIATGRMRPGSDIDALIFLAPFDLYIVPAEFIWLPHDDSFHSIFSKEPGVQEAGIQFDFTRIDWQEWSKPSFVWSEGRRVELAEGWIAFDRDGAVGQLIAAQTDYTENIRTQRLDEALVWLGQHLKWDDPQELWQSLGPTIAHDRLHAAYTYLVQALFAYNRRWQPWRNREMSYLLNLPWLPKEFAQRVLIALNAPGHDYASYHAQFLMLRTLFDEILAQLVHDGCYASDDPISEAFMRRAEEPGRAWNMVEWNVVHQNRQSTYVKYRDAERPGSITPETGVTSKKTRRKP